MAVIAYGSYCLWLLLLMALIAYIFYTNKRPTHENANYLRYLRFYSNRPNGWKGEPHNKCSEIYCNIISRNRESAKKLIVVVQVNQKRNRP